MSNVQDKVDFIKRRDRAIKEMDAVLNKYKIGLILVMTTGKIPNVITEIKPAIEYYDKTNLPEAPETNGKKTKAKKEKGK